MKFLKSLLIVISAIVSISSADAKTLVLALDLSDSNYVSKNFPGIQKKLGGSRVTKPHITLFGSMEVSTKNRQKAIKAIWEAIGKYKNECKFNHQNSNPKIYININDGIHHFGSYLAQTVKTSIYDGKKRYSFSRLIKLINDSLKKHKVKTYKNPQKSNYHMSIVKNKHLSNSLKNYRFPQPKEGVYIRGLTLFDYDDPTFKNRYDFSFKHKAKQKTLARRTNKKQSNQPKKPKKKKKS